MEEFIHTFGIATHFIMNVTKTTYNKIRYRRMNVLSCQSYKSLNIQNNTMYIVLEEYISYSKNITQIAIITINSVLKKPNLYSVKSTYPNYMLMNFEK